MGGDTLKTGRALLARLVFGGALFGGILTTTSAEDPHHGHVESSADPAEALSPELRQLLAREMRLIDDAMGDLLSAIASGDSGV